MPIDYAMSKREHPKLKAQLTRATKSGDPKKVEKACLDAMEAWSRWGAWPDDWSKWQRALDDTRPWHQQGDLRELRLAS